MAEPRPSNVVQFESPGASSGPSLSPEAAGLLGACRDRLIHGVATAFAGNLGKAKDDLLAMADRVTSLEQQHLYFAAMELLANRAQAMLEAFRSVYREQFDASLAGLHRGRGPEHLLQPGELDLIDTEDFERDLAIDKLSARAACACAHQLTALERRLAALLRLPRIGDQNPLYPRAVFNAMLSALGTLGVGNQLALTLLQELERQTSVELPAIYNGLNQALAESGVLPEIPVGPVRSAAHGEAEDLTAERRYETAPSPDLPGGAETRLDGAQRASEPLACLLEPAADPHEVPQRAPIGRPAGQDVFVQLIRALQGGLTSGAGPAPRLQLGLDPVVQGAGHVLVHPGGSAPALGAAQLIQALSSLQHGRTDVSGLPVPGPIAIDLESADVLRQLRATPLVCGSRPVDAMTVDIVALLFEAIFKDPELSAALRAEIAKLQIPVLKVALMDKTFFSNARDPARRLLDGIASASVGRDPSEEGRLTERVRAIVDEVVAGFDTDVDVFERQVQALEAFLKEEEGSAEARASEVVHELEAEERLAQTRARVDAEIASRTRGRRVPLLVAEFLDRHWRLVLADAYRRGGEQGDPWRQAVDTMEDLVWSVGPKRRAGDRERLLTTLPGLLKRLRAALEDLELSDVWDPFFAQLVRLHVAALRNETAPPQAVNPAPEPRSSEPPNPSATLSSFRTLAQVDAGTAIPFRPRELPAGKPTPAPAAAPPDEDDRHLQLARSLKVGAWVEFESDRGTRKTLRLSWVSELGGVYLFTNRQGENALTLAATSLAERLRKGTARILSQDRLTDRAVAQLLSNSSPP